MTLDKIYSEELLTQTDSRKIAVEFIKIVSDLWYDKSIELVLFRNKLIDRSVNDILSLHDYAGKFVEKPISIFQSIQIARAINKMELPPAKLDIGRLTYEYSLDENKFKDAFSFVSNILADAGSANNIKPRDVVLYGFGRIGRLIARELMSNLGKGSQLRLRAIVVRGNINEEILHKRASLLMHDSVHGDFSGVIKVNAAQEALNINGTTVKIISAARPEDIDFTEYGISNALVIDNTGAFRDKEALERIKACNGVDKVLLTAPGKDIPNIVYGVNHLENDPDKFEIFSAASCTTNAITPVLKIIEDTYGVKSGHIETIHAYTNDQNLVDNFHKKYRRGRAAALNMVITETGAGKAVSKALPSLEGKLTSNAIRVPIPTGSLAILNLELNNPTTVEGLNKTLKRSALEGKLVEQIKYEFNDELVSSDIVGSSAPSIFDSKATIVGKDGKNAILYVWYDNEYGYCHQVIRLAKYIAKVRRYRYY
ncbi:glyceraldehyde-3-phosphate dehydrogenase [Abyssalbus ytuae]|uniref:Glyceraldehyde-3-phosphate dehydrogenase n=1 Tax=Abyssalbus ytuae TaxID=2926907 RepID=A0A9E6ZL18_9FLAO|nr:glyceraldehyde-3-phosphate dehydrogenase [Abyssalbus ytuae]UOB16065.1 glyceraldehyde-3-phosphate dehydrogenase [Abyssalbus ytuae]